MRVLSESRIFADLADCADFWDSRILLSESGFSGFSGFAGLLSESQIFTDSADFHGF